MFFVSCLFNDNKVKRYKPGGLVVRLENREGSAPLLGRL